MFDADIFNVSSTEGVLLDPQQRMLLEAAWEAKAGLANAVPTDRSGVTVGISGNEYGRMADVVSAYTATGGALSVACGHMSYTFGMQGICLSVDTACSSSLVGSHIAISSIQSGESDSVTACGVNVTLSSATTEMFSKAGMLSKDGRCKTLDASADGYVRGEACVVLEMRALTCAIDAAGSPAVHSGCMVASAVNQDGRSSSLTAPNGPSSSVPFAAPCVLRGWIPSPWTGSRCTGQERRSAIPSRWAPPTPCSWSTPRRRASLPSPCQP